MKKKTKRKTKILQAMNKDKMTVAEIREFNSNVEFNQSASSWIMDIVCSIIFWPMIILAIRRRMKYCEKIEINNTETKSDNLNR